MYHKIDYSKYTLENTELCSLIHYSKNELFIGVSYQNINLPDNPRMNDYLTEYENKNHFSLLLS